MQRYEQEIEAILRRLEAQEASIRHAKDEESKDPPREKAHRGATFPYKIERVRRPSATSDRLIGIVCLLLVPSLILLPYIALLSAGLITLSIVLLMVSLKRHLLAGAPEDDPAGGDLGWKDVTVWARPGRTRTSGKWDPPGNPGDYTFWSR